MHIEPVRKSITVHTSQQRAFAVFTDGMDTWWPKTHHIGKVPMTRSVVEGHAGGRCYSAHEDGSECDWGRVLVWDPPQRLVFAWQVTGTYQYEPDIAKSTEVEVLFTAQPDGSTRVDLEHRCFERATDAAMAAAARESYNSKGAWEGMLQLFAKAAAQS